MNTKNLFNTIACCLICFAANSQISTIYGIDAKEFSKEIALYKAKYFAMTSIIGEANEVIKFKIDPLSAASSGELTSLVYQCDEKQKEGLILGFFGDYKNEFGVIHKGYAFLDFPKEKALILLNKLEKIIEEHSKYLNKDSDNNNIYFKDEEINFLIYSGSPSIKIRVFWKDFDSEWDMTAFKRTKRRLLHKLE